MIPTDINELSEADLKSLKQDMYKESKEGKRNFKNLLELILCRENIIHAIRKVKSNKGFKTKGVDEQKGIDFLNTEANKAFEIIRNAILDYKPSNVRRVMIPKANGKERPLGISTILDRVVQTAIANIIEPICEGQFFKHSYGFRPMRSVEHAIARISTLCTNNKRHWFVEGDIKGYFDNIDHKILIKKLYKMGIRDKRVLELIKKSLKAGIEGIKETNDIGTPQGSTISTLLANVYLNDFDHWVSKQWEEQEFVKKDRKGRNWEYLRKNTKLKEGYLIRYADDWIIMTTSEEEAIRWKKSCKRYLKENLKIELSDEKTKITDSRKESITFLGIDFFKREKRKDWWTLRTAPNMKRLREKKKILSKKLGEIRKSSRISESAMAIKICEYNSIVRGLNNYYRYTTLYNIVLSNIEWRMKDELMATKKKRNGKYGQIKSCQNLIPDFKRMGEIKTIYWKLDDINFGLAKLGGGTYVKPRALAQWANKYDRIGIEKYKEINKSYKETKDRNPFLSLENISDLIARNTDSIYTLEYFINRPMVFNRDKGKCKCCKQELTGNGDVNIHHLKPELPKDKRNKVPNLVTLCVNCHIETHREIMEHKKKERVKSKTSKSEPKKVRVSKKPSREILLEEITTKSYLEIGRKYEVSDNAVKKWAISYGIHELRKNKQKPKSHLI